MIDANLFCEIIESDNRVKFIRQEDCLDNIIIRVYESLKGIVYIDYDDDTFNDDLGRFYLLQLGLEDLAVIVYPKIYSDENFECSKCLDKGLVLEGEEFVKCDCIID